MQQTVLAQNLIRHGARTCGGFGCDLNVKIAEGVIRYRLSRQRRERRQRQKISAYAECGVKAVAVDLFDPVLPAALPEAEHCLA